MVYVFLKKKSIMLFYSFCNLYFKRSFYLGNLVGVVVIEVFINYFIFYNREVFIIEKIWFYIYKFLYIGIKLCGDVDE